MFTNRHSALAVILSAGFLLAGCNSDQIRAPDTPPSQLQSISMSCTPSSVPRGLQAQCAVNCVYAALNAQGQTVLTSGCRNLQCGSANSSIARIASQQGDVCVVDAVAVGVTNITGAVEGGNASTPLTVLAGQITGLDVRPATASIPVNTDIQLRAFALLSDNTEFEVTGDNGTTWTSGTPATASISNTAPTKGKVTGLQVSGAPVIMTATFSGQSDTSQVTVRNAQLIAGGLCVEPAPANYVPNPGVPCKPDTGACQPGNTSIFINQSRQFIARGRFDDGQECDLTIASALTWSTNPANVASIQNTSQPNAGRVTAGALPGVTNVNAAFGGQTGTAPLTVLAGGRIATNSLSVGVKADANLNGDGGNDDPLRKVFCVGAYDLVQGLAESDDLPAAQQTFARIRLCGDTAVSGPCADGFLGDTENEVASVNDLQWAIAGDYWGGNTCVVSNTGPQANPFPGAVGNTNAFAGTQTRDPAMKGNATGGRSATTSEPLTLGTACVQGTFTRPGFSGTAIDGATLIVLPATSDQILGDAVQLCNTLVPLFALGGGPTGSDGAVISLLTAVSDLVNPLLNQLGQGGLNGGLNTLLTQVSSGLTSADSGVLAPLTGPILNQVVQDAVDPGVFQPLNCALGGLLQAIAGGNPSQAQALAACAP